ncbi:MAG: helix-turn-helix domain-containing protein [Ferrovibrio sp.]|uniref:helix-turn-helix transcriptional regulator n=1 Tax=Ferrovibrio sp. TaxID=1917215 RepID=UPI00260BE2E2|nr:helix-turn-helix transcriptional regulator [Ferrovibrio sp.]MCW0234737.1 helix-turn-helix domain-containing protein [Ferrovibrio sp.]
MREKDILEALGAQIRDYRKSAGLTQQQLADKAGVSLDAIGNLERGEFFNSALTLFKIAQALGRNMDELFVGVTRVKKRGPEAAIDQAVGQFRAMLESGQAIEVEDLAAVFDKAAKKQPKAPKKRG